MLKITAPVLSRTSNEYGGKKSTIVMTFGWLK
jgi:hypothetical protein